MRLGSDANVTPAKNGHGGLNPKNDDSVGVRLRKLAGAE